MPNPTQFQFSWVFLIEHQLIYYRHAVPGPTIGLMYIRTIRLLLQQNPEQKPPILIQAFKREFRYLGESSLTAKLQSLKKVFSHKKAVPTRIPISLGSTTTRITTSRFSLGQTRKKTLQPVWTEPHIIVLVTLTAVKDVCIIFSVHQKRRTLQTPRPSGPLILTCKTS